jgi:transposase
MLQITPQMRILAAIEPVDFRKGIDALAHLCKQKLETDPFSGCLFLFRSRSATAVKILVYDSQGFWIAQKRLSKGRFQWWPEGQEASQSLEANQAQMLLAPETRRFRVRRVAAGKITKKGLRSESISGKLLLETCPSSGNIADAFSIAQTSSRSGD